MNQNIHTTKQTKRPSSHANAGSRATSGLRAWLVVLDAVLRAIEETAWGARGAFEQLYVRTIARLTSLGREVERGADVVSNLPERIARLAATGLMLTKVATSYRFHITRAAFVPERVGERLLERLHEQNARRFRETAETQGGAFLKVGQLLSTRPDLLPASYIAELSKLQDAAPALPFETVRAVVERELAGPLGEHFESFEELPLAAASIGQVHRARTIDGVDVAVKVQRPGIGELLEADMQLLVVFLEAMKSSLPPADFDTITAEITSMVLAEVDYEAEAEHGACVADALVTMPGFRVPRPVEGYCTGRVLTTELIEGRKLTDVLDVLAAEEGEAAKARTSAILGTLLEAYVRQILVVGRFHADPHPGNVLVMGDDTVVLLDFGATRLMTEEARREYLRLVQAFLVGDRDVMGEAFVALGFRTRSGRHETLHAFADVMLTELRARAADSEMRELDPEQLLAEASRLLAAATDDPVDVLPGEFIMIARVFGALGGLFLYYRPDVDLGRHLLPALVEATAALEAR